MNLKKFFKTHLPGLAFTAMSIVVTLIIHSLGFFDLLNYKILDFAFTTIRGPIAGETARQPIDRDSLDVVLVDIDDESWRLIPYPWPYPRDAIWAHVVRNLTDAGAKVIVFDLEFDSPDAKSTYLESLNATGSNIEFVHGDEVFADAIRYAQNAGTRVVLASKLVTETTRVPPQYIMTPEDRLLKADPELALINEIKDDDGTTRKYALYYELEHEPGTWYLTLGMKALKEYWGLPDGTLPELHLDRGEITYGGRVIKPYGYNAHIVVNFYGPPSGASLPGEESWKTFNRYPLSNIVDDAEFDLRYMEEDTDWMDFFKLNNPMYGILGDSPFIDKIVLIGVSVNVLLDIKETPYYNYAGIQQLMPGVEYHANAIQTILDKNYIGIAGGVIEMNWSSFWFNVFLISFLSIITFLMVQSFSPQIGGGIMFLEILVFADVALGKFTADAFWMLKLAGTFLLPRSFVVENSDLFSINVPGIGESVFVPIIQGIVAIILTYGFLVVYRFIVEQKDKNFLKDTFGTYISPELIDKMYEEKQMPELGGESGIRTAYFTDIASFSTFSEILSASKLVELLNEYLTEMTDILLSHEGTLDKYEGDAIVAFFGAPIYFEDHAYRATKTALDMQKALGGLREHWARHDDKWPEQVHYMRMRIGLNTGDLVTGNMGSRTRMNYTMMGDVVNTAARLEASAKQYGINIQTTMPTLEYADPDKFEWRFIDKVKVVGKSEAIEAVEILAEKGDLPDDRIEMMGIYSEGMDAYLKQEWDSAILKFTASEKLEEVFVKRPTNPSKVYVDRCELFKTSPPGDDWDGSWTLTSK